jgi:hypothetical protein
MPNAIKYNTSAETLALKKGNFWIGTGDVGKGPTSSTGFYNGITPPSGGYTIYLNKATGGPSIYTVNTEAQMVSLTNSIGSQNFTTSGQCLNWFATQTDKMIFNVDYPAIVTDGLILNLDAGFTPSYPTINTTWYDLSSGGNNGTLYNGPTFNSQNSGSIVFDGVDDYSQLPQNILNNTNYTGITFCAWIYRISGGQGLIVGVWNQTANGDQAALFLFGNSIVIAVSDGVTGEGGSTGVGNLNSNQWYYVVGTWNNSRTYRIYIDGVLGGISQQSGNGWNPTSSAQFEIGGENQANFRYFNGRIASTQVYNRTLSASEILQNYNAQKGRFGF